VTPIPLSPERSLFYLISMIKLPLWQLAITKNKVIS
jgi:hypothetical protein